MEAVKGIAEFYAGEAALPFVLAGAAGHKLLTAPGEYAKLNTSIGQEEAMTALFANPLGLSPAGIGSVNAGELDERFLEEIAGENGLVRRYGLVLEKLRSRRPIVRQTLTLRITEVSYCQQDQNCGPGDSTPGIQPFLYFDFRADTPQDQFTNGGHVFDDTFVMPYDAAFYYLLQYRGKAPPFG